MNPQQKLYFDSVARQVSAHFMVNPAKLEALVSHLGGRDIVHRWGHDIRSTCPIHHGDNNQAFVLWYDRRQPTWKCFTDCHMQGNLVYLIRQKYRCEAEAALGWLASFVGIQWDGEMADIPKEVLEEAAIHQFDRRMGLESSLAEYQFPEDMVAQSKEWQCDYFTGRGYSQEVLDRYEVGFVQGGRWVWTDPKSERRVGWFKDRCSIPIRDPEGQLAGFFGRRIDGVDHLKYKALTGTRRNKTLYGLHLPETQERIRESKTLVMVEGFSDVWRGWMHQCYPLVAPCGTSLSTEQKRILSRFDLRLIILFYDADLAGQTAAKSLAKDLQTIARVKSVSPPVDMDPGELVEKNMFWRPLRQALTQ